MRRIYDRLILKYRVILEVLSHLNGAAPQDRLRTLAIEFDRFNRR